MAGNEHSLQNEGEIWQGKLAHRVWDIQARSIYRKLLIVRCSVNICALVRSDSSPVSTEALLAIEDPMATLRHAE